jgi:hypothetical protein
MREDKWTKERRKRKEGIMDNWGENGIKKTRKIGRKEETVEQNSSRERKRKR